MIQAGPSKHWIAQVIEAVSARLRLLWLLALLALLLTGCASTNNYLVHTNDAAALESAARASIKQLIEINEGAQLLVEETKGILVFPKTLKAGLTFGSQYGEGVLIEADEVTGYYNSISASFGLQAGVQSFAYALLITNESALAHIKQSRGWEIGLGPSLVFANRGLGKSLTTTTLRSDIYAFVYDQKGLMAGSGLQGTKISQIHPRKNSKVDS